MTWRWGCAGGVGQRGHRWRGLPVPRLIFRGGCAIFVTNLRTPSLPYMKPSVCVCCGKPISPKGHLFSRNPNLCASCSSMVDGMNELEEIAELASTPAEPHREPTPEIREGLAKPRGG
jgi:hypothetical protein